MKDLFWEGSYINFKKRLINLTPLTEVAILKNIKIFNDMKYTPSTGSMLQAPNIIEGSVRSYHTIAEGGINKAPIIIDPPVKLLGEGLDKSKNNKNK